jgi:hypothetical protein
MQFDILGDCLCFFKSFYEITVIPLLHIPRIKVKVRGDRKTDNHILATSLVDDKLLVTF